MAVTAKHLCLARAALLSIAMLSVGCSRQSAENNSSMPSQLSVSGQSVSGQPVSGSAVSGHIAKQPTPEQWQRVAQLHILFAHQSVGGNLIDGIQSLASEQHIPLVISESRSALVGPGIQHFHVGRNEDPNGKLVDFKATFDSIPGNALDKPAGSDSAADSTNNPATDVALLKFCFIDFTSSTDPQQLAQHYIATLDDMARSHPHTVFVPITTPLTTVQSGPKAWLKKLLGQEPGGYASNALRHTFNQALRAHYSDKLFDLAALEANGGRGNVEFHGQPIEALDPDLSDDGGHLNPAGQRLIGGALIAHLATVGPAPAQNQIPIQNQAPTQNQTPMDTP